MFFLIFIFYIPKVLLKESLVVLQDVSLLLGLCFDSEDMCLDATLTRNLMLNRSMVYLYSLYFVTL